MNQTDISFSLHLLGITAAGMPHDSKFYLGWHPSSLTAKKIIAFMLFMHKFIVYL
jgi:hypothetical protein